jgi:hypothetical protein
MFKSFVFLWKKRTEAIHYSPTRFPVFESTENGIQVRKNEQPGQSVKEQFEIKQTTHHPKHNPMVLLR